MRTEPRPLNDQETDLLTSLLTSYQQRLGTKMAESDTTAERTALEGLSKQVADLRDLLYANLFPQNRH